MQQFEWVHAAWLGLAIVRRLVGLMGGVVTMESEVGAGTRCLCALPLVHGESAAIRPTRVTAPVAPPVASRRLLVAEDDAIRRLRLAATAQNHAVCAAAAARRGLPAPMPVIQGWTVSDYLLSVDWMPVVEWPSLVGVGSMCRRQACHCCSTLSRRAWAIVVKAGVKAVVNLSK